MTASNLSPYTQACVLQGSHVRLEPLAQAHCADLEVAVGSLHTLWYTMIPKPEEMASEITRRQQLHAQGQWLPFAVVLQESGKAVGMSSYLQIEAAERRLEIGATWLQASLQGGVVNAECKLLLLAHAFETLGCIAVELRTHSQNAQSRAAIVKLGAKLDGILRQHRRLPNGSLRDTCVYSILDYEWPQVKANLLRRVQREPAV